MAWQGPQGLGGNGSSGDGTSQSNQPQGTEYTLQGVMRFLQTEWHRHERDRNGWEIERQEMRVRIAALEGNGRRSDVQQKGLRKYVKMLEKALAAERKKDKTANGVAEEVKDGELAEASKLKPHTRTAPEKPTTSFAVQQPGDADKEEDPDRSGLKTYLDGCANEFTYLMVSPSNPQPPREPQAQHNLALEEIGQAEQAAQSQQALEEMYLPKQSMRDIARQSQQANQQAPQQAQQNLPLRNNDAQAIPMVRDQYQQEPVREQYQNQFQQSQPVEEDQVAQVNHTFDNYSRPAENETVVEPRKEAQTEADGWDFGETSEFPAPEVKVMPSRPDTDVFPIAPQELPKSPKRNAQRRRSSGSRRKSADGEQLSLGVAQKVDGNFKVRFGLRGHLDVVRSVIFTGGGSPGEPELCTAGDDGVVKRWIIPARYENGIHSGANDLDIQPYFTHRGHNGSVMCLTSYFPSANFASGGRAQGDGWVFSGGQDASIRVWERGRVDPKAVLDGHTDAVWAVCVLPTTCGAIFGQNTAYGPADRILLASGSADGTVKVWSVSAPPTLMSPSGSTGRRTGRQRGNSMSSGSAFPTSPQPSVASTTPFNYTLVHSISRENSTASPTSIASLGPRGESFCVSYSDAAVLVYDTRTGEEMAAMASLETYDGTTATGVNAVVATTTGLDSSLTFDASRGLSEEDVVVGGATGSQAGIEGTVISGHEDRYIRFFDANSGQCTYNMLAHPAAISCLSMSPDGRELVSGGHDASLRFWSLEKRACAQEMTSHRLMRGEGVCSVVWSQDGRWVVSGGGDGVVKVFAR
ncbi:hypothetical protein V499_01809 [Pseudogymnoascus sp. VKM F-103]|nr:hypothetical protein V499_01809 [Pseudogymnoascus sp. VKM F-103]